MARFYRSDIGRNQSVSTEITGYTASTLIYLFELTGDDEYLHRAELTARFLLERSWDQQLRTFPFELPPFSDENGYRAYFFDCGIIVRGLLDVWRWTREPRLLEVATAASRAMIADFRNGGDFHPVLALPGKEALPRTDQWSRSPGCYQLKAALAWWDVANITGDDGLRNAYFEMLDSALASHRDFPCAAKMPHRTMDRLHAYGYFLEGMTPVLDRADCARAYAVALDSMACHLRGIAPVFARADVYAQLLRARIYSAAAIPLDASSAAEEADALGTFQASSQDPRIDGGFHFGISCGEISPHMNPVSTAFAVQALAMWQAYENGGIDAGSTLPCPKLI